ncbi:MAG: hypothetical protein O3B31_11555 [Chloroflexi bacterium]|nr:hypothetical protein [Chloroflexota bacterium]
MTDAPGSTDPPPAVAGGASTAITIDVSRFSSGQAARFGVRVLAAAGGKSELLLPATYGDDRDGDARFKAAAFDYAADIAALAAVISRVDRTREQPNGTASLHLSRLASPVGDVTVRGRVVFWSSHEALVELSAVDAAGHDVARGLSAYSLRPVVPGEGDEAGARS